MPNQSNQHRAAEFASLQPPDGPSSLDEDMDRARDAAVDAIAHVLPIDWRFRCDARDMLDNLLDEWAMRHKDGITVAREENRG